MSTDTAAPLPPLDESELSNSDDALLPSPLLEASQLSKTHDDTAQPQPRPEAEEAFPPGTTKKQRRKARRAAERALLEQSETAETLKPVIQPDLKARPASPMKKETKPQETKSQDVLEILNKLGRARSNVGAKIRPASPAPVAPLIEAIAAPQTPVSRPEVNKQPQSSKIPSTPTANFPRDVTTTAPVFFAAPAVQTPVRKKSPSRNAPVHFAPALQTPIRAKSPSRNVPVLPVTSGLFPRNVRPMTVSKTSYPAVVQPQMPATPTPAPYPSTFTTPQRSTVVLRSQEDRHFHLFQKLLAQFPAERKYLISPKQLVNESTRAEGIHVFVDASNIMIGFKDMLRLNGVQYCDMSFDSLALLMERRRPVAKRCFVGSHREANPLPQITRLVELSKAVGYECNVQEQVLIVREESEKKKFFNDVNRIGWQKAMQKRSGSGSDSETGTAAAPKTPSAPKWVEQGVDELLHLKMCQSIIDTEVPSTIVLATGDGAEAEMSDGFLAHVERALKRGWNVELVTWRQQTNGGYKRKAFRQKWGEQFTIIELDDFLEDLIDTP